MHNGHGQLDMPHALAPNSIISHFNAAPVAYNALEFRPAALVLAARAFIALSRAKYSLAEQPVLLRPQSPVIYSLGLLDLTA